MQRQIILDTETTGLDPKKGHRIIEIGCLELIDRRLTGKVFHYYLNPERDIDISATAIHGLTNDYLSNKPKFAEIMDEFLAFVNQAELVIHNAIFDLSFINEELKKNKHKKQIESYCTVLDTLVMARSLYTGQRNSLDALCKRFKVDNSNRKYHGALLDAELLTEVYLLMTGGQVNMNFSDLDHHNNDLELANKIIRNSNVSIPLIYPSKQELLDHEKFAKDYL